MVFWRRCSLEVSFDHGKAMLTTVILFHTDGQIG